MKVKNILIFLVLSMSCKENNNEFYVFNPEEIEEKEISLSDIADDITYVQFDNSIPIDGTNPNFAPIYVNNKIYLFENETGILTFRGDGKFLNKVGKYGRGPGEYIRGSEFTVDEKTGTLYVCDFGNIVKVFSVAGEFLRDFSLNKYGGSIDEIQFYNDCLFITYNLQYQYSKYDWILSDTLGKLLKKKDRSLPLFKSNYLAGGGIYIYNNNLVYWNHFLDTVYSINLDFSYRANFILSPGNYRFPN